MSKEILRIATRKSPLAVWQAEFVAAELMSRIAGLEVELVRMSTRGDRILDAPLARVGGKGLFVKELEQGILDGRADMAVHSMKDVPVEFPPGLHIGAILQREDPRDALVSPVYSGLEQIPDGAVIGTSSLRRQCQIRARLPGCRIENLRGNVNTRLQKLEQGHYDAIMLAAAGMKRLGFESAITRVLDPSECLPAIGQGAIGVECREDDTRVKTCLELLNHPQTAICVRAERAMNSRLNGGCQVPIAGFAELDGDRLRMRGIVGSADGVSLIREELFGSAEQPEALGTELAERLLARGADRILAPLLGE